MSWPTFSWDIQNKSRPWPVPSGHLFPAAYYFPPRYRSCQNRFPLPRGPVVPGPPNTARPPLTPALFGFKPNPEVLFFLFSPPWREIGFSPAKEVSVPPFWCFCISPPLFTVTHLERPVPFPLSSFSLPLSNKLLHVMTALCSVPGSVLSRIGAQANCVFLPFCPNPFLPSFSTCTSLFPKCSCSNLTRGPDPSFFDHPIVFLKPSLSVSFCFLSPAFHLLSPPPLAGNDSPYGFLLFFPWGVLFLHSSLFPSLLRPLRAPFSKLRKLPPLSSFSYVETEVPFAFVLLCSCPIVSCRISRFPS